MPAGTFLISKIAFGICFFYPIYSVSAHSLIIEAHETGTGDGTVTKWYTEWGSYDRDFTRQKRLVIMVRDFSRKVSAVTIQVYFIGHPMGRSEPLFIYGHAAFPVELHGNLEVKGEVDAPPIRANVQYYAALDRSYVSGGDIDGWIVIGEYQGRAFQVRASRQRLLDLAERNRATLDTMVADYERQKSHH